ncbi:hypothetical protein DX03_13170 [Stenotrophomonas rhizophila]|nr:hypothetical protein DX03_13170 [Stenotrophomonas rhizophila]
MWTMKNRIAASAVNAVPSCEQGKCINCDKSGLLVHPFRYSAFCSDEETILARVPALSPSSGDALPELTCSKYAIRMMREGYLYVVLVRNGLKYIDSYYVRSSGRLMRFRGTPPARKTSGLACKRMSTSPNALMVAIDAPEQVSMTYWLFTPDPLSEGKEGELIAQAEVLLADGTLQGFSPQKWADQRESEQYLLSPTTISYFALEYAVASQIAGYSVGQVPMIRALDEQPFPALCDSGDPPLPPAFSDDQRGPFYQSRLNASLPVLRESLALLQSENGVGIALQDAIGITQELNAWRNRAMEGMEGWMDVVDNHGVDNRWKYLAARQYADIKEGVLSGRIKDAQRSAEDASNREFDRTIADLEAQRGIRGALDPRPMIEVVKMTKKLDPWGLRAAEVEAARLRARERYQEAEASLDGRQVSILTEFDERAEVCESAMSLRAVDHLAWLRSQMLTLAWRSYDQDDFIQGWAFAIQVGLATNGMDADDQSRQVMDEWWRTLEDAQKSDAALNEKNLVWRVFVHNNLTLAKQLANALEIARVSPREQDEWAIVAATNGAAAKVLGLFAKADSALRACEQAGQVAWFKRNVIGVSMAWYVSWGRVMLSTATNSKADQAYLKLLIKLMQLRMGSYAQGIPIGAFHATPTSGALLSYWRGQVGIAIREGVRLETAKGRAGGAYQGRVLLMATIFESVNLIVRGKQFSVDDPVSREGGALIASGLALVGGVVAIAEGATGWVSKNAQSGSPLAQHFDAWKGRLGLYGGFLAGSAGLLGAILDAGSFRDMNRRGKSTLASAYASRAIVASLAAVLSITVAFAGSAPYLQAMMKSSRNASTRTFFRVSSGVAVRIAAHEAVMLMLRVWGGRLGWVTIGLSVLIVLMSPDDFEDWCEKTVFRGDKSKRGYGSAAEELATIVHLSVKGNS